MTYKSSSWTTWNIQRTGWQRKCPFCDILISFLSSMRWYLYFLYTRLASMCTRTEAWQAACLTAGCLHCIGCRINAASSWPETRRWAYPYRACVAVALRFLRHIWARTVVTAFGGDVSRGANSNRCRCAATSSSFLFKQSLNLKVHFKLWSAPVLSELSRKVQYPQFFV